MRTDYENWINTPGPQRLLSDTVETLMGKGTIWFPEGLPWAAEFRQSVKDTLSVEVSDMNIEFVDIEALDIQPIDLIFSFDPLAQDKYLPAFDPAWFIKDNRILANTVLWLYGLNTENSQRWIDISRSLAKAGALLKIVCEGCFMSMPAKNIKSVLVNEYVSDFDVLLYAMTACQNNSHNADVKLYASRLAVNLSSGKPESICMLLSEFEKLVLEPDQWALTVLEAAPSDMIKNSIRNAQIMSLLPKTEEKRAILVDLLQDRLGVLLPFDDDFGNKISELDEIELRHIAYFRNSNMLSLSSFESSMLDFVHRVRNDLAHRKIVAGEDAISILEH